MNYLCCIFLYLYQCFHIAMPFTYGAQTDIQQSKCDQAIILYSEIKVAVFYVPANTVQVIWEKVLQVKRPNQQQGCSLGLKRLGLETVSTRFSNVSVLSRSRDSNVSVLSWSWHHTSYLHRTSKFKLRTITIKITKFSILYRYLGCLSISVEDRNFCLFLNYELFNTIALKT